MEPPGTAGAPGRPWEEAKAFYDNLAPKKKPKSVRAPEVPNRVELPTLDGKQRPLPGCPILAGCLPLHVSSPPGPPGGLWVPYLLQVLWDFPGCLIFSEFSGGTLWVPHLPQLPWDPHACLCFF